MKFRTRNPRDGNWTLVGITNVIGFGPNLLYREPVRQKYPGADLAA